jgi:hypothetical protein
MVLVAASVQNSRSNLGMMMFFCVIGIIFTVVSSRPNASALKLDSQGFTVRFWFKENTYRWIDVKAFKIITTRYGRHPGEPFGRLQFLRQLQTKRRVEDRR